MACTVIHTNSRHIKLVSQQINELFKDGKKPTIKDPFITFMYEIYKNSKLHQLIMGSEDAKEFNKPYTFIDP